MTETQLQRIRGKRLEVQVLDQPQEVKFCRKCVVSNQRPRIVFGDEGVCSACNYAEYKYNEIDWAAREKKLEILLDKHRAEDGSYDVIVPASGGKDSGFVAHQLKEKWGMNPLTVTWAPFVYTDIGYKNFQNFIHSGFDNLLATPNGALHRKLSKLAFLTVGDAWQPFTYGQICYAFHIALKFGIKLVFFGENGEAEYGGDVNTIDLPGMPLEDWRVNYFKGAGLDDLVKLGIEEKFFTEKDARNNFFFYRPPALEDMQKAGCEFHWFSYYNKWIPQDNYYYCKEHTGFEANPEGRSEGTYSKYASLDDQMDGFHFYLAFIKFGIARMTADAAHEIRDGHITREEGMALVQRYDGEFPGLYFKEFLEYTDIIEDEFWEVVDSWRQPQLWEKKDNDWRLKHAVYYPEDAIKPL
ncbi:MAG: LPS biosynthesis protein PseA [Rhodospirillaceae bacterium]|jgi:N-acetyl sugar amidotransferase|nr:LPS biosynthesis protein PseA [Rhodospirillaceae bacterium]